MKKVAKIVYLAAAAVFIIFGTSTYAQEAPPGNIAEMWTMHADPEAVGAFEDAFKEHVALRQENGDPFNWQTYTTNTGDDFAAYYVRACCFTWADRDAYDAWNEEHPQVEEHWNSSVAPHVVGYEHDFEEVDLENSHWPDGGTTPKFVGVTTYKLSPGGWQATDSAKAEMSQIAINNGWASDEHRWAWMSSVNGHPTISLVLPYNDYADMAEPDPNFYEFLSEQVGAEEAAGHFERFNSGTRGMYYEIYTHRPELSMAE